MFNHKSSRLLKYVLSLVCIITFLALIYPAESVRAAESGTTIEQAPINPAFSGFLSQRNRSPYKTAHQALNPTGLIPSPLLLPFDQNVKKNNAPNLSGTAYPSSYDLRTKNKLTPVRDQLTSSSCWAFAAMGSLESSLMPGDTEDFSENNLKNNSGFDVGPNDGGNCTMAMAYLARWDGPVSEADDPYDPESTTSSTYEPQKHVQEMLRFGYTDYSYNDIKNALTKYGAVSTSMYFSSDFLNSSTNSFYYPIANADVGMNHDVDIVGWDDNYSKTKFINTPPGNGAFIVRNSYGSSWGDSGYFYVSYYDKYIAVNNTVYNDSEQTDNYSTVYQYDPLGWEGNLGAGTTTGWMANAFTATSAQPLAAVSFYTPVPNTTYEIRVYNNFNGTFSTKTALKSGTIAMAGYHTINLGTSVPVAAGERFAVSVKLNTPSYNYPVPIEKPVDGFSSEATNSPGQSYFSSNGVNWVDLTSATDQSLAQSNVCLKAFTSGAAPLKSLAVNPTSMNLAAGETGDIALTATYTDNSTEDVTSEASWSSNSDSIATVDTGTVTAVAKGTATITAGYKGKTATVSVNVTPTVASLQADPANVSLLVGRYQTVKVNAIYDDGTKSDVSKNIQWTSDDDTVATMTSKGIKGIALGNTTLHGKYNDELTVDVAVKVTLSVKSLTTDPKSLNLIIDGNQAIVLNAVYSDNSTEEVSSAASWKSSSPSIATVDNTGNVTAIGKGTATITAAYAGKTATIAVKVTPEVSGLQANFENVSLLVGKSQAIKVNATYDDGSTEDVSKNIQWTSDDEGVAVMTSTGIRGVSVGDTTLHGQYNDYLYVDINVKVTFPVKSLTADPKSLNLVIDDSQAIALNAVYTDNSPEEVSSAASWKSSNSNIATVDSTGTVTAVAKGTATITAIYSGKTATISVKVTPPIQDLQAGQTNVSLLVGKFQAVKVNVEYEDGSKEDVSKSIQWTSDDEGVAVMTGTGIRGVSVGQTILRGQYNNDFSVEVNVRVTLAVKSLTADPKSVNLVIDENQAIALNAVYSDNTSEEVSSTASWKSSNASIASVDDAGTVTAAGKGTATITATFGGKTATVPVKVTPPIQEIQVDLTNVSLLVGRSQAVKVNVLYEDGSKEDVSKSIQWTSDDEGVAVMTGTGIKGVSVGNTTLHGQYNESLSVDVNVRVTIPVKSLTPDQKTLNLNTGDSQAISLNAVYSDNSTEEVSGSASWKSSKTNIAAVDETGTITAQAKGTATITATYGGKTATITVKVTPLVTGLSVDLQNVSLLVGKYQAVKVSVVYDDGSKQDVTRSIQWTSDDDTIATMASSGIKGVALGDTTLHGQYNDEYSVEVHVRVTNPVKSLTADQTTIYLNTGGTQAIAVNAVYSDNSSEDVTGVTSWKSSNEGIATVDSQGTVTGVAKGTATITATYAGKTATVAVKVTPVVTDIKVDLGNVALLVGKTQAVKVSLIYDDGSKEDVTNSIQWTSDDETVAVMTSTGIKGVALGETMLTGQYNDEYSVQVHVRVTIPVKSLTPDPTSLSMGVDETQAITLNAVYSDSTTEDVTSSASWKSSSDTIATVDSQGLVTAVGKGTATITATFGGKTASIKVTVTDPNANAAAAVVINTPLATSTNVVANNDKELPLTEKLQVENAFSENGKVTKKI